ncbi:hypothetical protein [Actinoplanes sp. NPDC089786]|uniref:hypothetical protein n=1 Tax=Actinoplanes sp. NPDC089786 TaxID=3155185 RepID=UPI0034252372
MSDLRDLMSDVTTDLAAVRWPSADELRGRVRRRRRRNLVAVAGAVIVVTAGATGLATAGGPPSPMPAAPPVSAAPVPVEIPRSMLLSPADVGAGPDSQIDGPDAFRPLQPDELTLCLTTNSSGLKLPQVPRFSVGVTLLLGTEASRPERPFVLAQQIHRYAGPDAVAVLRDLRSVVAACGIRTVTGEVTAAGGAKVAARVTHTWSIAAENFAGDDSVVVRHDVSAVDASTGRPLDGGGSELVAYVRVGDLVTRIVPRDQPLPELRKIAAQAGTRLCGASDPPC